MNANPISPLNFSILTPEILEHLKFILEGTLDNSYVGISIINIKKASERLFRIDASSKIDTLTV